MDWNNINTNRDTSGLGPIEYDQSKVPALIRQYADDVRTKTYGQEVREAQARNAEVAGLIASEAVDTSNDTKVRQDNVETQFNSIQQELTDKDVISAPEIIAARGGESTLSARLDKEKQEVSAQLAQTTKKTNDFILLSDYADNTGQTIVDSEVQSAFDYAIENELSVRVDGKFKLTKPLTIPNNTIPALFGDGVEQSELIFDIDGDDYALTVKTYHIRPLKIKDLTIRAERNDRTIKQNGVKVDFGAWGGSVQIDNVFITNFTGVLYNPVNTFNCYHHNLQLRGANVDPYVATLLKITKASGAFSNVSEFVGCGFQYGKIAIQNLGGANYSFEQCQFEHLNLFLHAPLITNPGVSNTMYFKSNWFEKISKGIINADINEETLEPITPISNRSNINFINFEANYDGGVTPTPFLSEETEPGKSKNFILNYGNRTILRTFEGWEELTLLSGWTGTLKTFRRADGVVILIGNGLKPGTTLANTTIATLPFRSEGAVSISAINGNSTVITSNAFWMNGDKLFTPASTNYAGAPHSFSIMYYERQ